MSDTSEHIPWARYLLLQPCQGCNNYVTRYTNDRSELVVLATKGTLCDTCYADEQYARDYAGEKTQ